MKRAVAAVLLVVCSLFVRSVIRAQNVDDLNRQIEQYQQKISDLQGQAETLSSEIQLLDSRITLTTLKITATRNQIAKLTGEISDLSTQIDTLENLKTERLKLVLHRVPETYKRMVAPDFGLLLLSPDFTRFMLGVKYLSSVQAEDTKLYEQFQLTQNDYTAMKDLREEKKSQQVALNEELVAETTQLDRQKKEKQSLLTQTKNDEATYQSLLAQARAQLASFASFAASQGGGILGAQTHCDGWGCYYNQRDGQWANTLINGRNDCNGPCSLARVGCLITSVAMVASHMGHTDILPSDIAVSDPNNFSVGTAMLRYTISVKGVTITRIGTSLSPDTVKDQPVIAGIRYGPFGTHFVVIKSYTDGRYIMDDPYQENGYDKVFTDSYSLGSVFEVDQVSI